MSEQIDKYPVRVSWRFWLGAAISITTSVSILSVVIAREADSSDWPFFLLIVLVAGLHLLPLALVVRAMKRANIAVTMEGIKFTTTQSLDFIPWADVLEVSAEGEKLVTRVRQPTQIPFMRIKRRFVHRLDDVQAALDTIHQHMRQREPYDDSAMHVRSPDR